MGGPERAPQAPRRSERPGEAVSLLDLPVDFPTLGYSAMIRPFAVVS